MNSKPCNTCGQTALGSINECVTCKRKRQQRVASARWRAKNPSYSKEYFLKNRKAKRAYQKAWLVKNPTKTSQYTKAYRDKNPGAAAASTRKYIQNNPELIRNKSARRRAIKKQNGSYLVSAKELKRLYAMPCFYCGASAKHLDHVIPISRGGCHSIGNLVPACASCNLLKSDKTITEWKMSQRRDKIRERTKGRIASAIRR
jgi:hypothetical protein